MNELDNRGSTFYLALYWAQALAAQDRDTELKARFLTLSQELAESESKIAQELINAQGEAVDIGGYFKPDEAKTAASMRPSQTLNRILESI